MQLVAVSVSLFLVYHEGAAGSCVLAPSGSWQPAAATTVITTTATTTMIAAGVAAVIVADAVVNKLDSN